MAECLERPCETGIDLLGTSAGNRQNLRRSVSRLGDFRALLIGLLVVLLSVSLMTAWGGTQRAAADHLTSAASFSGDDAYDPAAGSELARLSQAAWSSFSGDDAYDPATGARPAAAFHSAPQSLSGDDAYDPAAGSWLARLTNRARAISYSGDDAYDLAAGGIPQ